MFSFLRRLPYRRLVCLLLAAGQLMPLPDLPEIHRDQSIVPLARVFPDYNHTVAP